MNPEIIKWQMLRNRADVLLKQTLNDEQKSQENSKIAKALVIYVRSDHTIKCLEMSRKKHSKSQN